MSSSISEALVKIRPDLNKEKKFRALTPERQTALMGDYRDPDAEPAKEGALSSAEVLVGSEINRQLAEEAQRKLAQHEAFYKQHAIGLAALVALGLIGVVAFSMSGRGDVRARAARAEVSETGAAAIKAPQVVAAVAAVQTPIVAVAKPQAPEANPDEMPALHSTPVVSAQQTAALNPVARTAADVAAMTSKPAADKGGIVIASIEAPAASTQKIETKTETKTEIAKAPAPEKVIAAAPAATTMLVPAAKAPASAAAPKGSALFGAGPDGLEDGASVANESSVVAATKSTPVLAAAPAAAAGEVLYEAAPVPTASKTAPTTAKAHKSADDNSDADASDSEGLRVTGIFWDKTRPLALINDKIVEIGANVNGAKVTAIDPSSITIVQDGKTRVLHP